MGKEKEHVDPQFILPFGVTEVTVPCPLPDFITVKVYDAGIGVNVAVILTVLPLARYTLIC